MVQVDWRGQRLFSAMFLLLFSAAYASRIPRFISDFPNSYTWSELMIAYQGGYLRRGLLGHLAFLLDDGIGARPFLILVVLLSYAFTLAFCVRLAAKLGPWIGAVFLLSPATLLFPLLDHNAFGRKDAIILLAFTLSCGISARYKTIPSLLCTTLIYVVANFVVESSIFYYPLAFFVVLRRRPAGERAPSGLMASTLVSLGVLGLSALNLLLNKIGAESDMAFHQQVVVGAWRARYPTAFGANSAIEYIGMSVTEGVELVGMAVGDGLTLASYLACFILALVPSALVARRVDWNRLGLFEIGFGLYAVAWEFGPCIFAADWGRYIHLIAIQTFVAAACLPLRPALAPSRPSRPMVAAVAIALYASTWHMVHFAGRGESALMPGVIVSRP